MTYLRLHSHHSRLVYTVGPYTDDEAAAILAAARDWHEAVPPGVDVGRLELAGAIRMFDYWVDEAA
jgi:hypothetical protein